MPKNEQSQDLTRQYLEEERTVLAHIQDSTTAEFVSDSPGINLYETVERACTLAATAVYGLEETTEISLEVGRPPKHFPGIDLAVGMFPLAPLAKTSPQTISTEVASKLNTDTSPDISHVSSVGPYVNFQLDREEVYDQVVHDAIERGDDFGNNTSLTGQRILVDYSSPNIAKRLGLQHAPTTFVGEAIARACETSGAVVIRANHVGDYGTPIGKVLIGMERYFDAYKFEDDPVAHLHELYVHINHEAGLDPEVHQAARQAFARLEQGEQTAVGAWLQIRAVSMAENDRLYSRLGIRFDTSMGESHFATTAQRLTEELLAKGIATESPDDGSVVVLPDFDQGTPFMLRKDDGSSLYGTRELAAMKYRVDTFAPDVIKYVVGAEQTSHFESSFAIASLAGYVTGKTRLEHVKLGLLADESGKKISSRNGGATTFEEILDTAYGAAYRQLCERYKDQPDKLAQAAQLAETLGNGAVAYSIMRSDPAANTVISENVGATKDAGTAGYLQYAHARTASLLRKVEIDDETLIGAPIRFTSPLEWSTAQAVMDFPGAVAQAAQTNGVHRIAQSLENVAGKFNALWQSSDVPILQAPGDLARSRIALTRAVQRTLRNGLYLLVMQAPNEI